MKAAVGIVLVGAVVSGCSTARPSADASRRYVSSAVASARASLLSDLPQAQPTTSAAAASGPIEVQGLVRLGGPGSSRTDFRTNADGSCSGAGGFTRLTGGDAVVIADATSGRTLARTALQAGSVENGGETCDLIFAASSVPDSDLYSITVTGLEPLTKEKADLTGRLVTIDATD